MKNEEKYINVLQRKIIRTERKKNFLVINNNYINIVLDNLSF